MLRPLLALLAVAALASAAHAPLGDCGTGPLGIRKLTTKAGIFYVEDRLTTAADEQRVNLWEETNGILAHDPAHALQRGGYCSFEGWCWGEWCVDDPHVEPDFSHLF